MGTKSSLDIGGLTLCIYAWSLLTPLDLTAAECDLGSSSQSTKFSESSY